MDTCYYHPEAKAPAICPDCGMPVCDRCRLEGDRTRCVACVTYGPGGGLMDDAGNYGAATADYEQPVCTVHADLAADMQCMNCMRPFCLSCVSTGYCPDCAPSMRGKKARPDDYQPQETAYVADYPEVALNESYSGDFTEPSTIGNDFSGSYGDAPPRPKRKKPAGTGTPKKGAPAGKAAPGKKGAKGKPKRKSSSLPIPMIAAGVGALALVGAVAFFIMGAPGESEAGFAGPTKVTILAPAAGKPLTGPQVIRLKVASEEELERVDLTIDGKFWAKFTEPPFESDWPTGIISNGSHKVSAKATYKGGKVVADTKTFTTKNKPLPGFTP